MGNGNSYFIENLEDININVINALENSLITKKVMCNFDVNPKPNEIVEMYDFRRYGFILKNNYNISDIEILLNVKKGNKNEKKNLI